MELPDGAAPGHWARSAYASTAGAPSSSCARRYRSYDPASGTFLGRDGRRRACE
ncbi:BA14K family protein [Bradyrhizobium genosp. A]|uniref:BA14K family protein n=1 Tax=Bradyrhizobium genosp. A TaxID=83626 RepID=UPI003CF16DCA